MRKKIFILLICAILITSYFSIGFASKSAFNGFANEILNWRDEEATKALDSSYAQYDVSFEPYSIDENVSHHYVMGITKQGSSNTYYTHIIFESAPDLSCADGIFMFFPVDHDLWNDDAYYVIMSSYVGYFVEKLTSKETDENLIFNVLTEYLMTLNSYKTGNYDTNTELYLSNIENETFGLSLSENENKSNMVLLAYLKS